MKKTPPLGRFFYEGLAALSFVLLFASWMTSTHFLPWISWHNEILAFASVLLMSGALLKAYFDHGRATVLLPRVAWPFGLLSIVVAIQASTGYIPFLGDAAVLVFYFVLCTLSLLVGYAATSLDKSRSLPGAKLVEKFAILMVLGGCVSVFVALAQSLDIWESATGWIVRAQSFRRPGGNVAQPNQLATLLLFSIASLVYLFEIRRVSAVAASLIALVLVCGLALTESRSGVVGLLLMTAWWFAKRRSAGFALSAGSIWLWVGFFFFCFLLFPTCINILQEGRGTESTLAQVNSSPGTRLVVWPQLWHAALMRPWLGWGLREISTAHNAVLHAYPESEAFTYAHNIILDLAVGIGLPLTFSLSCVTLVWMWRRAVAVRDPVTWYCLAVLLPFGVHSMLEFPFAYAYFLVPVMFAVGVLEATQAPRSVVRMGWWPAAVGFGAVTALMAWSVVEYIAVEEDFRIVRFEALQVGQTPSDYERPKIYLLTQLDALLEAGRIVPAPGMAPERIELSRKVALRYPWTATQNRYALSLALNGNPQEALRQLKVMRAMHGEKTYEGIKANWTELAHTKYPQLKALALP